MEGFKLSAELEGKYKVLTHLPCLHHSQLGLVDFRTMTEEQAEQLIEAGTIYLKRIKKRKAAN